MSYMSHNAIIVTSQDTNGLQQAANKAIELGLQILGPSVPQINNVSTILICPDGSKEGWAESNAGDLKRAKFRNWLEWQHYDDNSTIFEWVEIAYNNEYPPVIVDNSCGGRSGFEE